MRICFVGDSFVNGTGDDDCLGWPGRLCAEARQRGRDITLYNLGVRRYTSGDVLAGWEQEAAARLPAEYDGRVVFSFGVNDCVPGTDGLPRVPEDASVANTRAILTRARARWPALMVGPPRTGHSEIDLRLKRLTDRYEQLCKEISVPFLHLFNEAGGDQAWQREVAQGDGVHPNRGGYSAIYDAVLMWQPWRDWVF
jgi:lysophospholipase L1-like esterase